MLFRSNDTATTEIYTRTYTLSLHDALPIFKCLAGIGILLLYFALLQDLIVGRMGSLGDLKHVLGQLIKVAVP